MNTIVDNYSFTEYDGHSEQYEVPADTTVLEDNAFYDRSYLKELVVPDNVRSIGDYAFKLCFRLETISLPEEVDSWGTGVFQQCHRLSVLRLPEGIRHIDAGMLVSCHSLREIFIPGSIEGIDESVFSSAESLSVIHIPLEKFHVIPDSAKLVAAVTLMEDFSLTSFEPSENKGDAFYEYVSDYLADVTDRVIETGNVTVLRYLVKRFGNCSGNRGTILDRVMDSGNSALIQVLLETSVEADPYTNNDWDPFA